MGITTREFGPYAKGSRLTTAEMDENFNYLNSKPYKVYTALLTQNGGDEPDIIFGGNGSVLDFGQSFLIISNPDNYDLTIYGAANNNVGTWFVCNDPLSPILEYTNSLELQVNYGAPVVTVLENTIGNVWFTYNAAGEYFLNTNSELTVAKTIALITPNFSTGYNAIGVQYGNSDFLGITTISLGDSILPQNGALYNTPIEIRVYN